MSGNPFEAAMPKADPEVQGRRIARALDTQLILWGQRC